MQAKCMNTEGKIDKQRSEHVGSDDDARKRRPMTATLSDMGDWLARSVTTSCKLCREW